jgi:hypothetical protein
MQRLSIRTLMAIVFLVAVGLLALRNANDLWAVLALLTALAASCASVKRAFRAEERPWYTGYAILSGAYLLLAFMPTLTSRLPTTHLLNYVYAKSLGFPVPITNAHAFWWSYSYAKDEIEHLKAMKRGPGDREFDALTRMLGRLENPSDGPKKQAAFVTTGHSLLALLSGLVGGTIGVWFYGRQERQESA